MRWTACPRHALVYLRNCCSPIDQSISLLYARPLVVRHHAAPLTAVLLLTRARTSMSIRERHHSTPHHRHEHTQECLSTRPQMACRDSAAPARMSMQRPHAPSDSMRARLSRRCHNITHSSTRVVLNLHHFIALHSLAVIALLACGHAGGSCEARTQRARSIEHSLIDDRSTPSGRASRSLTRSFDRSMIQLNISLYLEKQFRYIWDKSPKRFGHLWDNSTTATL